MADTMEAPAMHASRQTAETMAQASYWRNLCPNLHVDDAAFQQKIIAHKIEVASRSSCEDVRQRLVNEGFAVLEPSAMKWSVDVGVLADAVEKLVKHGWAPTFLALYDEAWAMGVNAQDIMSKATGNSMCMDIVGFMVNPANAKGFSPHRDRQPEDWMLRGVPASVPATFKPDGMAKYVTIWTALTDASADNSCLHYIPRDVDPGFYEGDAEDADPMGEIFSKDMSAFRNIRPAPVAAGGSVFHTHRTIHWGSSGRPSYVGRPRISLSIGFSDPKFEPPYFSTKLLPFPPLGHRVALASAQVLNYATLSVGDAMGWTALAGSMAQCTTSVLTMLHKAFQKHAKAFHKTYRQEISRKFVTATLELGIPTSKKGVDGTSAAASHAGETDDEDEALDAMLRAESKSGEVLFYDDFDLLNADCNGDWGPSKKKQIKKKLKRKQHDIPPPNRKQMQTDAVQLGASKQSTRRKKKRHR